MKEIGRGILLEQGGGWLKLHRVQEEDIAAITNALESELRQEPSPYLFRCHRCGASMNNIATQTHECGKKSPEHVCGLAGYNGMIDPPCPACEASRPAIGKKS